MVENDLEKGYVRQFHKGTSATELRSDESLLDQAGEIQLLDYALPPHPSLGRLMPA